MTRYALAVHPSAEVVAAVAALARPELAGVTWSVPEQWIVKVRPLGHVVEALVDPLVEALTAELAGAPPVTCTLGPVTQRPSGGWLTVPVAGLEELGEAVFAATEVLVPVTHPQPFRADLVIARGPVPKKVAGEPITGSWVADELVLVADRSAPKRPRLEDVATFPFEP